ncbi:MAG: hypothetical protein AABY00_03670 [Nanoarchaeota archaeon]
MKEISFSRLIHITLESIWLLLKHPVFLIPSLFAMCWMILISLISLKIQFSLRTDFHQILWMIVYLLLVIVGLSACFAWIFLLARKALHSSSKNVFSFTLWRRSFVFYFLFVFSLVILWAIIQYGLLWIGPLLNIPLAFAQVLYILLFFVAFVGFLIFYTYTPALLVTLSFSQSLKQSITLTKKNYLLTLSLSVIYFVLISLCEKLLSSSVFEIFEYSLSLSEILIAFLITPLLALILVLIVHEAS